MPSTKDHNRVQKAPTSAQANPAILLIVIALVVFLVEVTESRLFALLPPMPEGIDILIDGLLMFSILTVLLYLFLMRPMMAEIRLREQAEQELRDFNAHLENLVEDRTSELEGVNRELRYSVDEQKKTEATLRRNNAFIARVFDNCGCLLVAFDAVNRHCIYSNSRITTLLGFEQESFAVVGSDIAVNLVADHDRERFIAEVDTATNHPSEEPRWTQFEFRTAAKKPVRLSVGLSALELTVTGQAKELLLTAIPTAV